MSANYWEPVAVVETVSGQQNVLIRGKQLSQGIIRISGDIDEELADRVISQMMYLIGEHKDIRLFVNSRGGSWAAVLSIVDMIRMYRGRVSTYCTGSLSSVGALILSAAKKGNRYIFPHGNVIINQPRISSGISGSEDELRGYICGLKYEKGIFLDLLAEHTSQKRSDIEKLITEDCFLTAEDAIDFGLCDKIVESLDFNHGFND